MQVGITLVGVLTGVFGGARSPPTSRPLCADPRLAPFAEPLALAMVVIVTTYLTLVLGELVPKQLALRRPERVAAASPARSPCWRAWRPRRSGCWASSSALVLRAFGPEPAAAAAR